LIRYNTLTPNEMHAVNRSAILDFIRRHGPTSRPSIARELHFSLPTVMRIVDEFIDEGLVLPTGETEYSGGRRRPLLEINSRASAIIGIDMGGTAIYGAATDLCGSVLVEARLANQPAPAEESYDRLAGLIERLLHDETIAGRQVLGLAVGTQGLTSHQQGIVLRDPIQNWINYPLQQKLNADFQIPVVIDNDVYLAALGELWFGVDQNARNMVFITVGNGIGAGMIVDGALYRSSNYLAGEIGYILPGMQYLGTERGPFGILESQASLPAITARAQALLAAAGDPRAASMTPEGIFQAMRESQPWAEQVIDEMVDYLSMSIAATCAVMDPDLVVLRSGLDLYTDLLIEPILRRISGVVPVAPRLVASKLGYKATALGAVVEVFYDTNNFYTIRKLR
jgi:glucokinase